VKFGGDVDVHSLEALHFGLLDLAHPLSTDLEMSLYGYE
jgi:hypothetical protein